MSRRNGAQKTQPVRLSTTSESTESWVKNMLGIPTGKIPDLLAKDDFDTITIS